MTHGEEKRKFQRQFMTITVDFPFAISHVMSSSLSTQTVAHTKTIENYYFFSSSAVLVLVLRLMPTHCENRKISLRLAEIDFSCKIFVGALSLAATTVGRLLKFSELESARQSLCVGFSRKSWEIPGSRPDQWDSECSGSVDEKRLLSRRNGREWKATM